VWHKKDGMAPSRAPRPRPPLDDKGLEELALRYVGKYATTRSKLGAYLARKLRERGWGGSREADLEGMANRLAELGYVDDAAYALAKSRALGSRGYGKRRLDQKLRQAGVDDEDSAAAREHAEREAVDAALRFAERRRIGPFASAGGDPKQREKAIGAMVRAGHSFALARAIIDWPRDAEIDPRELADRAGLTLSESRFPDTGSDVNETKW
jgi:regulatory protein